MAQNRKSVEATVEKVFNVPVFMYSYPNTEFEEVDNVNATMSAIANAFDEESSVSDKIKELVSKAKNKKNKGKVEDFDALIVNPEDYQAILVKFKEEESRTAVVKKMLGVPVYMYSYPNEEYEEVKTIEAIMNLLGGGTLEDSIKELINKAKKKEKKGKIKHFDAIIVSPDDLSGILIKFN